MVRLSLSGTVVEIVCVNNITGRDFKSLTDRDLKDLIPQFLQRKRLRDWMIGVVSGATSLVQDEDGDSISENQELIGSRGSSPISEAEAEADKSEDTPEARTSKKRSSTTPGILRKKRVVQNSQEKSRQAVPSLGESSVTVNDRPQLEGVVSLAQHLNLVVPASVRECRRKMEMLTSRARNETISSALIILQATIGRDRPSQSEFEVCAQKIVALVPELKDPLPPIRQDAFKEWNTACMLLKKAYYNRKIVEKPRRKRGELEESCETASTQEGHDHQLIKEMKKAKPDMKKLHSLMTASFPHRRKWIVKQQGKGTVKKILEEYPGFNIYPVIMIETYLITKAHEYREAWNKLLPSMWDWVKEDCSDVLCDQEEDEIGLIDNDGQTAIILKCLPRAWGIKEPFIHFLDETVNFETFIKKDLNADCHLVATDKDDKEQLFVVVENEVLLETDSYMRGLFSFFGVHHVFNLEFPQKLKLCFKFLEEYIFGVPQKKKTVQYRNGVSKLLS